ncbi:M24 family metallopeptidase [Natrialbaceae archaeon A-CW2]
MRDAVSAVEKAFEHVHDVLKSASIQNGVLVNDGTPLNSQTLARRITTTLLDHDCMLADPLVACGSESADPHGRSTGSIQAGEPILIDLGPQHISSGYYADISRTFVKGEPPSDLHSRYELVSSSLERVQEMIEPGVTEEEVNDVLCSVFEDRGYDTPRTKNNIDSGVLHYMGHGIGLNVHEKPLCTPTGGEFEKGNILAIEPALYDPDHGGIRLEDVFRVTDDGCENLVNFPKTFVVQ